MPALQLRLPDVVMAVDEAGTDDLVCAVDNFGVGVRGDGFADFGDRCASNEEVGMVKDLYIVSMYAAAKLYCTPEEIQAGYDYYNPTCLEYGGVEFTPYAKVEPNLTNDYIASLPVASYDDYKNVTIFNTPVLISRSYWEIARDTTVSKDLSLGMSC